jgi:hypothetical protein
LAHPVKKWHIIGRKNNPQNTPLKPQNKMPSRAEIARMHLDRAERYGDAKTFNASKERAHYRKAATALRFGSSTPPPPIARTLSHMEEKFEMIQQGKRPRSLESGTPDDEDQKLIYFRDQALYNLHSACAKETKMALSSMSFIATDFPELVSFLHILARSIKNGAQLDLELIEKEAREHPDLKRLVAHLPKNLRLLAERVRAMREKGGTHAYTLVALLTM